MAANAVPVELVDKIVKSAYEVDDNTTIACCALVDSKWRAASRPYVFREVRLSTEARLDQLKALLDREADIGPLIRTLTLRPHQGPVGTPSPWPCPWLSAVGANLSPALSRLRAIKLIDVYDYGDAFNQEFVDGFASFTSVERLTIDQCALNLAVVRCVATALPALRLLDVGHIKPLPLLVEGLEERHVPRLTSLRLDIGEIYPYGFRDMAQWVMNTPTRDTLHSATLVARMATAQAVGNFINDFGPQLVELDLQLELRYPAPVEAEGTQVRRFLRMHKHSIFLESCSHWFRHRATSVYRPAVSHASSSLADDSDHPRTVVSSYLSPSAPAILGSADDGRGRRASGLCSPRGPHQ